MSVTLPNVYARVCATINDMDARTGSDRVFIHNVIRNAYTTLQARLPAYESVTTSAFSITGETFSLPTTSSAEYAGLVWIRLQSNGIFLIQVGNDELNAFKSGVQNLVSAATIPQFFSLYEDNTQTVQGRCWPPAAKAETVDLYRTLCEADFDLTNVEGTTLTLSRFGIQALIYQSAAEIAATFDAEALKLRRLNPQVIPLWFRQAEDMRWREMSRRHSIESKGRIQRWVTS